MKIATIKNPRYVDKVNSMIDVDVTLEDGQELPFTSMAGDISLHGQVIFMAAKLGAYGAVAPYVSPPEEGT